MEGGMGLFDEDASESTWAPVDTPQQRLERLLQLQPPPQPRKALKKDRGREPFSASPLPLSLQCLRAHERIGLFLFLFLLASEFRNMYVAVELFSWRALQ